MASYEIHPRIGVARLGNSPNEFYLAPETVGGLPVACDENGNVTNPDNPDFVSTFKDNVGRVLRQAAKFKIFRNEAGKLTAVTLAEVKSIEWTVHLANKKPIWYTFSELIGDLEFGQTNSYSANHVPVNNGQVTDPAERQALIIDPGPRSISLPGTAVEISRYNIPADYPKGSFPPASAGGAPINSLGTLKMDNKGNLVALGAYGNVTGSGDITSFRGASNYWDDISDGYVVATITLKNDTVIEADPAWLLVGSPKYAPELVNITHLYDTMFDTAIRDATYGSTPSIYDPTCGSAYTYEQIEAVYVAQEGSSTSMENSASYTPLANFNADYEANYARDIKPIFDRMNGYRWVANVPAMQSFVNFDGTNASPIIRWQLFKMFRVPLLPDAYTNGLTTINNGPHQLFSTESAGLPLMPLNSGDNSVTNSGPIYKFETLSATQYFYLFQWAIGKYNTAVPIPPNDATQMDIAHAGNCVGAPFSPGIETTWIVRNASIYSNIGQLKLANAANGYAELAAYYQTNGLSINADEAEGQGCEPGDLTKRMAIPWQADFQECTVQTPNISIPNINQFADGTGIEVPPAYYVYWWPPQSPMHVMTGSINKNEQVLDAIVSGIDGQPIIPAGQRVPFQRGILNVQDIINSWFRLGFIVNQGNEYFDNFVEQEREYQAFGQMAATQHANQIQSTQYK